MGVFGFGKKRKTVDLTKNNSRHIPLQRDLPMSGDMVDLRKVNNVLNNFDVRINQGNSSAEDSDTNSGNFDFLDVGTDYGSDNSFNSSTSSHGNPLMDVSEISELKNKMRTMTSKMEDHSNEVYRLMQRIELLERKIERFEGR